MNAPRTLTEIFLQTGSEVNPAYYKIGTSSFSRGYIGRDVALTTHPRLTPRLKKELSYTSTRPLCLDGRLCGEHYV